MAREVGDWIEIEFSNTGDTIPEENLKTIFEKFYRMDSARSSETGGAGLGLAIAKQIVEAHEGRITAMSQDGETKFIVVLPQEEKEARKNQRVVEIKEVRLGLNIDIGDFNTKVAQATRFLQHGDKVKVNIRFRGREMAHPEMGLEPMRRFAEALAEIAVIEKPAKLEGRNMMMFLAPKAAK